MKATRALFLAVTALLAGQALAADPAAAKDPPNAREELSDVFRQTPSAARGSKLFPACVGCHGKDGNGQPQGDVPAIAQQHQRVIAKQLVDYRHAERWDLRMEEVASTHRLGPPRDIADLAAFISTLPRESKEGHGDGRNVEHGGQVYLRDCAGCHGADAKGKEAMKTRDLSSADVQKQSDADLSGIIANGKGKMPPYKTMTPDQVKDMVAYIRSLKK